MDANSSVHKSCGLKAEFLPCSSAGNRPKNAVLALLLGRHDLRTSCSEKNRDNSEVIHESQCSLEFKPDRADNRRGDSEESDMEIAAPLPLVQSQSADGDSEDEESSENDEPVCPEKPTTKGGSASDLGPTCHGVLRICEQSCEVSRSPSREPAQQRRQQQKVDQGLDSDIEATNGARVSVTNALRKGYFPSTERRIQSGLKRSHPNHCPPNKNELLSLLRKNGITKKRKS